MLQSERIAKTKSVKMAAVSVVNAISLVLRFTIPPGASRRLRSRVGFPVGFGPRSQATAGTRPELLHRRSVKALAQKVEIDFKSPKEVFVYLRSQRDQW